MWRAGASHCLRCLPCPHSPLDLPDVHTQEHLVLPRLQLQSCRMSAPSDGSTAGGKPQFSYGREAPSPSCLPLPHRSAEASPGSWGSSPGVSCDSGFTSTDLFSDSASFWASARPAGVSEYLIRGRHTRVSLCSKHPQARTNGQLPVTHTPLAPWGHAAHSVSCPVCILLGAQFWGVQDEPPTQATPELF